VSRTHGVRF